MEALEGGELERRAPASILEEFEVLPVRLLKSALRVDVKSDQREVPPKVLSAGGPWASVAIPVPRADSAIALPDVSGHERNVERGTREV